MALQIFVQTNRLAINSADLAIIINWRLQSPSKSTLLFPPSSNCALKFYDNKTEEPLLSIKIFTIYINGAPYWWCDDDDDNNADNLCDVVDLPTWSRAADWVIMMMSKVILLAVMNVIVMMVYMILLISPPEVELLTENEQLLHSFHCASRVVALLGRRKFKTFIRSLKFKV